MKDVNVLSAKSEKEIRLDYLYALFKHVAAAAAGFILCKALFFENYAPFGVAFVAGCSASLLPSAAIGVFIGYLLPLFGAAGFKYVAAALAVLAVRFMLVFNKKLISHPVFAAAVSALAVGITGAAARPTVKRDPLLFALEVLICGISALTVSRTSAFITHIDRGLSDEELGCLLIVLGMVLSGLYGLSVFGLRPACVLAVLLILAVSKFSGAAGTGSAVAVSVFFFFAGKSVQECFIYTVAAFFAGLVGAYGKYVQLSAFFGSCIVFGVLRGISGETALFITEAALGCLLFAFLPKSAGIQLARVFTCFPQISVNNDLNRAVTLRLTEAAQGIKDVKSTVDDVAARLEDINAPSFSAVLSGAEAEACGGCKLRAHCWEAKRDVTLDAVFSVIKQVKTGAGNEAALPGDFAARCLRPQSFTAAVKKGYLEYAGIIAGNSRIGDIRRAVVDQFEGISIMLEELSREYLSDVRFDNSAAVRAVGALKNLGICADECSAPVDKYGRMEINLKLSKGNEAVLNKRDIMRALSLSCERNFAPPVIKNTSGETFISISERAEYGIDIGVFQRSAKPGDVCGDAYSYFTDGKGHFIMILSDGMGAGSRAAVDSAMASGLMSRLIKSGFGFDCALKILNSSMLFKSADESLATMDIASIDLHTGAVELYKAGAAPTLIKRGGKVGRAVSTSMPIGILSSVSFDRAGIKLSDRDVTVLISDGAAPDGTDWLKEELLRFSRGTAQDLAERLATVAEARRADGHKDDITVVAAILKKQ